MATINAPTQLFRIGYHMSIQFIRRSAMSAVLTKITPEILRKLVEGLR